MRSGKDRVHAVMMPSRYTSQMSVDDAREQAARSACDYSVIADRRDVRSHARPRLRGEFAGRTPDTTEENIQSRCRGCC